VAHDLRLALRAHHHRAAVALPQLDQLGQRRVVLLRRQPAHPLAAAGLDQEVEVEAHRAGLRRPGDELRQLVAVAAGDRRLDDEVEARPAQPLDGGQRVGQRAVAVAEAVVVALLERVDRQRHPAHPGSLSEAMRSSVSRVPLVPTTTVAPRREAWAAISSRSSRSSGSPPDSTNSGAGLIARISSAIRRHSSVVSSPPAPCHGPAAM
jgi:hypothetical protein